MNGVEAKAQSDLIRTYWANPRKYTGMLNEKMITERNHAVIFDLGGVVVRIAQTWQQALTAAGLTAPLLSQPAVLLTDFAPFNQYQATTLTLDEYIRDLAVFLAITKDEALQTHLSILREMYEGMDDVIDSLNARGVPTGCLSNTNAPHWHSMTETEPFAPVARLKLRAGSHELGFAKPDPRCFQAYAEMFELTGKTIVYFDDALKNVEVARSLGWDAHVVDPYGNPADQVSEVLERLQI